MRIIIITFLVLFLTGCSSVKDINVINTTEGRQNLNISQPDPLKLDGMKWYVITPENYHIIFKELEDGNIVLFSLDAEGYEALSKNTAKMKNYIRKQQDIIKAYKKYYESERRNQ